MLLHGQRRGGRLTGRLPGRNQPRDRRLPQRPGEGPGTVHAGPSQPDQPGPRPVLPAPRGGRVSRRSSHNRLLWTRPEGGAGHHPCVQIYAEASGSKRDARHHAYDPRDSVAALLGSPPPAISRSSAGATCRAGPASSWSAPTRTGSTPGCGYAAICSARGAARRHADERGRLTVRLRRGDEPSRGHHRAGHGRAEHQLPRDVERRLDLRGVDPVYLGRTTQVWDCTLTDVRTGRRLAIFRCTQLTLANPSQGRARPLVHTASMLGCEHLPRSVFSASFPQP
jgi:hypothetical protein